MATNTTATTQNHNGTGSQNNFAISFAFLANTEVDVKVGGVLKTIGTHYNIVGSQVQFTSGNTPPSGTANILLTRDTDISNKKVDFADGSVLTETDLDNNSDQILFAQQEFTNDFVKRDGSQTVTGNLVFEGATDDDNETTLAITDPTADRTITVPDITGTLITTADTGTVSTNMIAGDAVTNAKIADNQIDSEHYVDGSIDHVHLANDAVDGDNIADDSINSEHYVDGSIDTQHIAADQITNALIADNQIDSEHYVDGSIDRVHLEADIINSTKLADDAVGSEHIQTNSVTDSEIATGTLDNRYYTETELNNGQLNNQYYTETELNAGQLDNRYYTETELDAGQLDNRYFTETELTSGGLIDSRYYTETELDAGQLDNRYYTETELNAGQLDNRYYTETEAEARFLRQDSSETIASGATWSNSDAFVATTAAINARIIDLVDDVGGFSTIATELVFPNTNPQGTTGQAAILSIGSLSQAYTPSGTTVTIANGTIGNSTVTITGVPSVLPQGFGILVESTSTLNTYTFHRLVPKATEITTVASNITNIVNAGANVADINNFADIYIISASEPSQRNDGTSLQEGDLWFDSSNDNLQVYTGSAFSIITPSQSVLDDVAIVSGAITYSEDLGLITSAVSTGSSNGSLDIVADAIEDEVTFTVTAATGKFIIDGVDKPALTLYKGWTYTFDVSDASNATHPLRFSSGGSAYNTGVVVTGTQGQTGAKVQLVVPESQPTSFIYYCTSHSGMGNTITVKNDPIKTVSDNITSINTVASDLTEGTSEIDTVATNITNVNNVGNNISNVNAVHNNATNINAAVSNASNINTVAGSITNVNTTANNMAQVQNFANVYRIDSSDPSTNNDEGDLYFNTTSNELRVYNGTTWQGGVTATGNLAGLGANTFTGNISFSGSQTVDGRDVSVDGTKLDTIETNATADQTASEIVSLISGQTIAPSVITTTNLTLDFGSIT
jgi:hypothetical protein|tara:strand:- start:771 stop:3671 length:2901 start_codon:yes stop_codon:yes gene_type:complete